MTDLPVSQSTIPCSYNDEARVFADMQILGFDILLKSDGMPILLEVNASPSMRLDYEQQVSAGVVEVVKSPVDEEIKKALVLDTLLLVAPRIRTVSSQASGMASTRPISSARYRRRQLFVMNLVLNFNVLSV